MGGFALCPRSRYGYPLTAAVDGCIRSRGSQYAIAEQFVNSSMAEMVNERCLPLLLVTLEAVE